MYSKSIFCFLILGLLTLARINSEVINSYTGKCNDIYKYLESQGKVNNFNDCKTNNKGEVIELRIYPYCLTNQHLENLLSYKTIETLEFTNIFANHLDLDDSEIFYKFDCEYYDTVPTNLYIFLSTLTKLKSLDMVGMMNNDISIITKIPKSIKVLKIGEILSDDMMLTQKMIDVLSKFKNLTSLTLREIGISENLDFRKFAKLKKLTTLEIFYHNDFYPKDISISGNMLKNFRYLKKLIIYEAKLDDNTINAISNMTQLEELRMDMHIYQGESNFNSINKLKKLTSLVLNCGVNPLSTNLFYLPQLKSLSLSRCGLINTSKNDTLTYSTLKKLEYLNIDNNNNNYNNLYINHENNYFDINHLGDLISLKEVHIYDEGYNTIPESIGNLKNLEIFTLDGSKLESIPKSLFTLENLKYLSIGGNLTSFLDEIGNLKNLEELHFSSGSITSLPESIGNLVNLKVLDVPKNEIVEFPKSILNLNITSLNLRENCIEIIPDEIGNMKNLEFMDLSYNTITNIPSSIGNIKNLKTLYIYRNKITSLPESIGNLVNLENLTINGNYINSLPESIGNLINLEYLDVSYNGITNIPSSIGNLSKLERLYLNYNKIKELPNSIGNLKNLKSLGISNNLIDSIPDFIKDLKNLENFYFEL